MPQALTSKLHRLSVPLFCLALSIAMLSPVLSAQTAPASDSTSFKSGQQQPAPPEAGGPENDTGPYALPKVDTEKQPESPAPPPSPKPPEGMPSYSINVEVPLVSLDVLVLTKEGHFVPGLQKDQFRVLEDNVPQSIQSFGLTKAGYTVVLLVEFASTPAFQISRRQFLIDALRASYAFTDQMEKDDYVSVISYDMKPSILVDFTSDKQIFGSADGEMAPPSN